MNWYLDVIKKYTVFTGRSRRKEYWMFVLFNMIIAFVLGLVMGILGRITGIGPALGSGVNALYSLAILLPAIAVGVRRMHDTGHSGWWLLVPLVNLIFACTDSQPGPNEYGPNPKMAYAQPA